MFFPRTTSLLILLKIGCPVNFLVVSDDRTTANFEHCYLPKSSDAAIGVDGQLFSGDQLTVERAVNVIASVANGLTPQDRLDGIHLQLGDWHASVKLLSVRVHIGALELHSSPFKT